MGYLLKEKKATEIILLNLSYIYPGNVQMPDAMEIVFQAALEVARTGGVCIPLYVVAILSLAFMICYACLIFS